MKTEFKYYIVDDKPEEFGGLDVILGTNDKSVAKASLKTFKGVNEDSYSCQYYKIVTAREIRRLLISEDK